jgi:type II secretory pathway component PulC
VPSANAQTIADYSRAQRALLESAMAQASARSAGVGAAVPAAAASMAASAPPVPMPRMALPSATPMVQVSGVFAARDEAVAEVVVNATAYLLGVGQGVPGTSWRVDAVAVDRVVLTRQGAASPTDPDGARKVFALPALR